MDTEELAKRLFKARFPSQDWCGWPDHHEDWVCVADEARRLLASDPSADCVRVRIAVAVDAIGAVSAYGLANGETDSASMDCAIELLGGDPVVAQAFVEVDIPKIPTVTGRVE